MHPLLFVSYYFHEISVSIFSVFKILILVRQVILFPNILISAFLQKNSISVLSFFETSSHYVVEAGFKMVSSGNPPTSGSQGAGSAEYVSAPDLIALL
jgi:hypothetical protein